MAKEVWCAAGNRMVNLPDDAFDQSLMASAVSISPCEGCEHSGHIKKVAQIEGEVTNATSVGVERVAHLEHSVQVLVVSRDKSHVQCTCNCYLKTIKVN